MESVPHDLTKTGNVFRNIIFHVNFGEFKEFFEKIEGIFANHVKIRGI